MLRIAMAVLLLGLVPATAETIDATGGPAYPALFPPAVDGAPRPRDVVLMGADLVEIAVALGAADRILGRPDSVDLPGIEDTPHRIRQRAGLEGVVAMQPGIVAASTVLEEPLLAGLDALGIRTELIDRTLPATEKVRRMAALLGLHNRGEALVAAIEADYTRIRPVAIDGRKVRILHASKQGAGGNFSAGGSGTAVHNLIERVGALNAAAEVGRDRYRSVTPEGIILMAPDVVVISAAEVEAFGDLDTFWQDYPGLALTPAGRNRRLVVMQELQVRHDAASSGIATAALSDALNAMFR